MSNRSVLALGSDIKNRLLFGQAKTIYFGPEIGDLAESNNYSRFKKEAAKIVKKFRPKVIAHDLHPAYFSTRFARELSLSNAGIRLFPVQHHHAHIASVIFERELSKPVIGVSFDGTGYGTDGNIWGGEFLLVGLNNFKRLGYLKYQKMPGADRVILQPWRMVLSILGKMGVELAKGASRSDKDTVLKMMEKDINSPLTSSAGRLFDAAAALLGVCTKPSFEAEGPIKLEKMCQGEVTSAYEYTAKEEEGCSVIDTQPLFLAMVKDIKKRTPLKVIATKFHNSMADIVISTVTQHSGRLKVKDIVLSGGVFQNNFLRESVSERLVAAGFNVFSNKVLPINDLNIALGQYYVSRSSGKS